MRERRDQAPRRVDQPSPGWFRVRLVKGGPWVAAQITQDSEGRWQAAIDGKPSDGAHTDPAQATNVFRIWHYGERIAESEHAYLVAYAKHARANWPDSPEANPGRPIVIGRLPPPF